LCVNYIDFPQSGQHNFFFYCDTECDIYFKQSLFIVGEIGGNDVFSLIKVKTVGELREIVPLIVESISKTATVRYFKFK
jgi:hypothetical protein